MTRYTVQTDTVDGETLYRLQDTATGAWARVWPGFGNNCLGAQLPAPGGTLVDLLLDPGDLDPARQQPSWWGIPLLFPWAGRIPGGTYSFEGQRHQLPVLDMGGNAGHGFVKTRAWHVERAEGDDEAASLACSISSQQYPETLDGFPFPYRLETTYRLGPEGVSLNVTVHNPGSGALPFGFGAHPYFRLPLGSKSEPSDCLVHVPAASRWELSRVAGLAERPRVSREELVSPVADEHDLREPRALSGRHYDGVFTDLAPRHGRVECFVRDPGSGLEAVMRASANFPQIVVYTPPGRPGVCFEPWTCPPNVFNLAAKGVEGNGLLALEPGQRWQGQMLLSLRRGDQTP